MKQRKLRGYVLPILYVIILILVFGAVSFASNIMKTNPNYSYSTGIIKDISIPVVNMDGSITEGIIKPYISEKVSIDKYFYDINDNQDKQAESLIYFENTYMKNTGILYESDEIFDCVMVLDGTVLNIKEDDILGNVIEIEHNTNLRTIYYSVENIKVKVGDVLSQSEVIATSGANNLSENKNNLLFEVYYNGSLIDPEDFYNMDPSTLK